MARNLKSLRKQFIANADQALGLVRDAEEMYLGTPAGASIAYTPLHYSRIEYLYELAFIRIFIEWEVFLEETVLRCLVGVPTKRGKPTLKATKWLPSGKKFYKTLEDAKGAIFTDKYKAGYILWGNVDTALTVLGIHFNSIRHAQVLTASKRRLRHFCTVRNRIAHGTSNQKLKFNDATRALARKEYKGAKPGRFLRDWHKRTSGEIRWVHSIAKFLKSLARSIC
jgi:hypothetical protein